MKNIEHDRMMQKRYEKTIIEHFGIQNPVKIKIYYGKKAKNKAKENGISFFGKNGYFDYKKGKEELKIYVFNSSIGTLAHELYHAKQFERREVFFEGGGYERLKYKFLGANHKLERETDERVLEFLRIQEGSNEYKKYKYEVYKRRISSLIMPILIIIVVILILM